MQIPFSATITSIVVAECPDQRNKRVRAYLPATGQAGLANNLSADDAV